MGAGTAAIRRKRNNEKEETGHRNMFTATRMQGEKRESLVSGVMGYTFAEFSRHRVDAFHPQRAGDARCLREGADVHLAKFIVIVPERVIIIIVIIIEVFVDFAGDGHRRFAGDGHRC